MASSTTWRHAEERLFTLLDHRYDPLIARLYKGMNALDVGRVIYEQLQPNGYTAQECGRLLREYLVEEFHGVLLAMPGADALLRHVAGCYPLALASGSPLEAIHLVLERFAWSAYFALVISSESVPHGKPAPDVFLKTARQAGMAPAHCLVFEDSLHGARAARRAGMACFVVPSHADSNIAAEADRSFASLAEVTCADIEDVLRGR